MLDQMNYQIYPYHINKITNYENANYSPLLNFKNIQIRWRIKIPLYSPLPPNFQTQHNQVRVKSEVGIKMKKKKKFVHVYLFIKFLRAKKWCLSLGEVCW